jgi:hypothetical protein
LHGYSPHFVVTAPNLGDTGRNLLLWHPPIEATQRRVAARPLERGVQKACPRSEYSKPALITHENLYRIAHLEKADILLTILE